MEEYINSSVSFYDCFAYANKGVKELKRTIIILVQVGRSAVNKRPLTDGWQNYI